MKYRIGAPVALLTVIGFSFAGYSNLPREGIAASYTTPLGGRNRSQRHNALLALHSLDGAVVKTGEEFSFNKRVGTFSRDQGYRRAPVSYNGQLIDDWGGGVCQASTTLYNTALLAGMQITERHHHEFCPSYVPPGRDAAVAYSSIDLRFRNPYPFPMRIHSFIDHDRIRIDFISAHPLPVRPEVIQQVNEVQEPATFVLGRPGRAARVRNSGKEGCDVSVYRITDGRRELISSDEYPVMNRVVQYRD
ncbi:MAG TPA: VanW family protein [Fimbriimonas sp.]|nr:VanW family protein [Fimbriimonas sp.]